MSSGFYDMEEVYDYIVQEIAFLERKLADDKGWLNSVMVEGCECYRGISLRFGTDEGETDREEFDRHTTACNEYEIQKIEKLESHISELKELEKIMFDNGQRRKLALLALVMKRRK